jgi:hypothetical protein
MNDRILGAGNLTISRFFALDHRTYDVGALGTNTKENLGLASSLVRIPDIRRARARLDDLNGAA